MARKRSFALTIIDSDVFLDMPTSSRLLYYDLSMRADDEGFVNAPKKIMRMTGATEDDLRVLVTRKFLLPFETGVIVIKHWKIHNCIRNDMFHETTCIEEKSLLTEDEHGVYHLPENADVTYPLQGCNEDVTSSLQSCNEDVTQYNIIKSNIIKSNLVKSNLKQPVTKPVTKKTKLAEFVSMTEEQHSKLVEKYGAALTARAIEILDNYKGSTGKRYKDDYRTILSWAMAEAQKRTNEESKRGNNIHSELEALYSEVDYEKSDS